jgi:three-Cys-motif partner protein
MAHYDWKIGEALPELGAHSVAKHKVIEQYLDRYLDICVRTPAQEKQRLTIVDGFCGGGRYAFRGAELPGSPLVLLRTIAAAEKRLNACRPKGFQILTNFIFIDDKKEHTDFLRAEIEASEFVHLLDKSISIWTRPFTEAVDDLIVASKARHRKGQSIFILDQYGWSDVVFEDVRRILSELPKAEVFINFAVDTLIDYLSDKTAGTKAHSKIDLSPGLIREMVEHKSREKAWRAIIQNKLYDHIKKWTTADFYSPFFVRSPESGRSYWLLHLSRHREARNLIGEVHWEQSNVSTHHGRPGFGALGFSPNMKPEQMMLEYNFDADAQQQSLDALAEQIPSYVLGAVNDGRSTSLETVFGNECNDTPVTAAILETALIKLRDHRELKILNADGREKPRAKKIHWNDRVELPKQRTFYGPFGIAD